MADFLDMSIHVAYTRETPPESYKLMQQKQRVMASAYESGERVIQPSESGVKLVDNVTNFYLVASKPITLSFSDGTTFTKMDQFAYSSNVPISVAVSNQDGNAVKLSYAAGVKTA